MSTRTYTEGDVRAMLRHLAEVNRTYAAASQSPAANSGFLASADAFDHYAVSPVLDCYLDAGIVRAAAKRPASDASARRLARTGSLQPLSS